MFSRIFFHDALTLGYIILKPGNDKENSILSNNMIVMIANYFGNLQKFEWKYLSNTN